MFVFLVVAIITGQLAAALRKRAEDANRSERETRILYELVRITNSEEEVEQQLQTIAQTVVSVFSSWGVRECTLLLPDEHGTLTVRANAPRKDEPTSLSSDEISTALQVMKQGWVIGIHDVNETPRSATNAVHRVIVQFNPTLPITRLYMLPLTTGKHTIGVLRVRVQNGLRAFPGAERPQEGNIQVTQTNPRTTFFWTFIDQATAVIEHARLHRESMRVEVLQRTDALRAALLSSVSHDLRTPLSSIKAAASSLLQKDGQWDEEAQHSFALAIEREADRLNRLVGNLLDMSRIENGTLKPEKEWYPLDELIHGVLNHLEPIVDGRTITTNIPPDLLPLKFDYLQMDQVFTNLIENALRYTPRESPIEIEAHQQSSSVLINIADRGPGIPASDLERVFDKFYRVLPKKGRGPHPGSSGLGLAVSKGLIEAHNGRIWVQQRDGGGVVFTAELPREYAK